MAFFYVCMSVYNMHPWFTWKIEEGISSPATGVMDSCEPLCGCSDLNLVLLEEQPVLLNIAPVPRSVLFKCNKELAQD